jgi:hypothetical protein
MSGKRRIVIYMGNITARKPAAKRGYKDRHACSYSHLHVMDSTLAYHGLAATQESEQVTLPHKM